MERGEAVLIKEQAGGGYRQEVDIAARSQEEEELRQAIQLSLRHSDPPNLGLTSTSESLSEGAEAGLPEEQAAHDYRQEADVAARSHEEGQLGQALEPVPSLPRAPLPGACNYLGVRVGGGGGRGCSPLLRPSAPILSRFPYDVVCGFYVASFNKFCVMCIRAGRLAI